VFLAPLSETPKENIFWIVNGKVKLFRLSWISVVFHLFISLFLLLIIHLSVFFSFGFLFCLMWIQYWIPLNWTTNRFWRHDSWCPGNWIICVSLIMRSFVYIYIYIYIYINIKARQSFYLLEDWHCLERRVSNVGGLKDLPQCLC